MPLEGRARETNKMVEKGFPADDRKKKRKGTDVGVGREVIVRADAGQDCNGPPASRCTTHLCHNRYAHIYRDRHTK